jgi:hypothetical protein
MLWGNKNNREGKITILGIVSSVVHVRGRVSECVFVTTSQVVKVVKLGEHAMTPLSSYGRGGADVCVRGYDSLAFLVGRSFLAGGGKKERMKKKKSL